MPNPADQLREIAMSAFPDHEVDEEKFADLRSYCEEIVPVPPMTLLERAAEAVRNELGDYAVDDMWMTEGGLRSASHYRDLARAVLQAIREPSEGMKRAGVLAPNYLEDQSSARGCSNIFTAMIDAALEEK